MMITIAAASDQGHVSPHFGHCAAYDLFEADATHILGTRTVPNPGHAAGLPPEYLHGLGVDVVIAGGMGAAAIRLFNDLGITVVTGASGPAAEAAQEYLAGTLESTGAVCHGGDCGH